MATTTGERLKIALGAILWFILAVLALICVPVVGGVSRLLLVVLVALALVAALPVWLVRRMFSGAPRKPSYWATWLATALVLVSAMGLPVYYLAYRQEADPLVLPLVTLSNGQKTVVFQGMVHIGSENFYKSVVYDLEAALADGYDLFYEGVQPGDPESDRWFSETLASGGDLSAFYKMLGQLCGVQFQLDYFTLLEEDKARRPERHVVADVTNRQMLDEWNRLHPDDPWKPGQKSAETSDPIAEGLEILYGGSATRQQVTGIICRAMLSRGLEKKTPAEKDAVVLDFRNRKLADRIAEYPGDRIYVTYGAAHLAGVIELLRERDPRWQVVSTKWVRAIEAPQHFEGKAQFE